MLVFKYGIIIQTKQNGQHSEWRISLLGQTNNPHECIAVPRSIFDFAPTLGTSVKVGFPNSTSDTPTVISKCESYEWIRDVRVVDSKVVIFAIVHLSPNCLKTALQKRDSDDRRVHHIIKNEDTDFKRIAIPRQIVDQEVAFRSNLQKGDQMMMYRLGIVWDPATFTNGQRVPWRYYEDFSMVPVFEHYWRELTLPFLSESMVYGVLEGIVISTSAEGALVWSPKLGCAILSSATTVEMPALGDVCFNLVTRSLLNEAFEIPCYYELLPKVLKHVWHQLRVISDKQSGVVYLETECECSRLSEKGDKILCMNVPHIGRITRGLEPFQHLLTFGRKYKFRIAFEKTETSYEPVIIDLQLSNDAVLSCRIVYISPKLKQYFAVLNCQHSDFENYKNKFNFIIIPFRTFYCSQGMHLEQKNLLYHHLEVSVRESPDQQANVEAINVRAVTMAANDGLYRVVLGRTWLRTVAVITKIGPTRPIELMCSRLAQQITDFSRLSISMRNRNNFAVQAQFALAPGDIPMFLVRHVAMTLPELPKLTQQIVENLSPLREVFASLLPPPTAATTNPSHSSAMLNNRNSLLETTHESDRTGSIDMDRTRQEDSIMGRIAYEFPTIQEESALTLPNLPRYVTEEDELPLSNLGLLDAVPEVSSSNSAFEEQICTESMLGLDSTVASSRNVSRAPSVVSSAGRITRSDVMSGTNIPQSRFGYNISRSRGPNSTSSASSVHGFGPPKIVFRPCQVRAKPLKFGIRSLKSGMNDNEVVYEMAYKYTEIRPMIIGTMKMAIDSWMSRPIGTVKTTKRRACTVFGIEMIDCSEANEAGRCPYSCLVRFITHCSDMEMMDKTIIMPAGGLFSHLPKGFCLGKPYAAVHFSFSSDRMIRIAGYANGIGDEGLTPLAEDERRKDKDMIMMDNRGNKWLRFETRGGRLYTPLIESEVFELWEGLDHPGWILVEKTSALMKVLLNRDYNNYSQDQYRFLVEPLAGGPVEVTSLRPEQDFDEYELVMWRMVVEFSDSVPFPRLVDRVARYIQKETDEPARSIPIEEARKIVDGYGMYKTMGINQELAQERIDRLRALGDPRILRFEGPELTTEMKRRNVDVITRRDKMMDTFQLILKNLENLHEKGYFQSMKRSELEKLYELYESMHDNNHQYQFKKRTRSIVLGCNVMADMLVKGDLYKTMFDDEEVRKLLKEMCECIGLNSSYVKKSEEVKKMLQFMYKNKLYNQL